MGGQGVRTVYRLPQNDFLLSVLIPGLEEDIRETQRIENIVKEEERLFENAKKDSLSAQSYRAFTSYFLKDLEPHVDIYARSKEVNAEHNAKL